MIPTTYHGLRHESIGTAKEQMAANSPKNPSMADQAQQITKWISEAESHIERINAILFGHGPSEGSATIPPVGIAHVLDDASSRIASVCGSLSSIITRLDSGLN